MAEIGRGEESLRQGFRFVNRFMVMMWRLGWGPWVNFWPEGVGRIMVLVNRGRKSGVMRRTPVNYAKVDGEVYCMAGFGINSDWYRNIKAVPSVEVWLPEGWWAGVAEDVSDAPNRMAIIRQIAIASAFAGRLAGIDPNVISEEELERITTPYRLIHIRRTDARTGPGGPGDLAWVWPVATFVLAFMLLFRPRKRRGW
jgi:deazaflavin-dependent oxidoreductase (nitroreductase family)